MVVLRHLSGSDPNIEVTDQEMGGDSALTVHFKERRPNAALDIEQDARSVVVHDAPAVTLGSGDPGEVTQVTRNKREVSGGTHGRWLVWAETHWIALVIALSLAALAVFAAHWRR